MQNQKLVPGATMTLLFLFIVSLFNYLDRFVLSVLLPAIKEDLRLSDTQLGAVGTAFTLSYVLLGIPFARLADRYSRKAIISISLAIWSAMTAACGLAQNFIQLAIARVLVGVGEAGATPPAHSLISDYFPPSKRTKALSIFGLGAPVGIMVGFVLASWLVEQYNWRIAFISLGIPGVAFAVVCYLGLREPKRGQSDAAPRPETQAETQAVTQAVTHADTIDTVPRFREAVLALLSSPTYRHIAFATGLYTVVYIGVVSWLPSYFLRSFDMSLTEVGFWLAMSLGISQLLGMLSSGVVTDRFIQKDVRWYCWIPALAMLVSTPLFIVVFGTENSIFAAVALFPAFLIGIFQGPASFAAIQRIVHVRTRAMAVAVFLLITNMVGGAMGPLFTGWLSDQFVSAYGEQSLRWSLMLVSVFFGLWSCVHYALAARTIEVDIKA